MYYCCNKTDNLSHDLLEQEQVVSVINYPTVTLILTDLTSTTFLSLFFYFSRRMFPTVRCSFQNLRPDRKYYVLLDIVPCDNKRYRYAYHRSSWLVAGKADPPPPHRFYTHPDAPYTGDQLRKQVVSFEKVKLTNNEMDKNGQVSLFDFFNPTFHSNREIRGQFFFLPTRSFLRLSLLLTLSYISLPFSHFSKGDRTIRYSSLDFFFSPSLLPSK